MMLNQYIIKTEPDTNQPQSITLHWKLPTSAEIPRITLQEKISGSVAQLTEEENKLRSEKQHLIEIMDELENRLTYEIKSKKASIVALKAEVVELRKNCEELARALKIPIIK